MMFEKKFFFHHCQLSCYVMLQKAFQVNRNGGGQALVRGYGAPGPTIARALALSTKNDTPVANFVNSR